MTTTERSTSIWPEIRLQLVRLPARLPIGQTLPWLLRLGLGVPSSWCNTLSSLLCSTPKQCSQNSDIHALNWQYVPNRLREYKDWCSKGVSCILWLRTCKGIDLCKMDQAVAKGLCSRDFVGLPASSSTTRLGSSTFGSFEIWQDKHCHRNTHRTSATRTNSSYSSMNLVTCAVVFIRLIQYVTGSLTLWSDLWT